jgi:hypothetical protein
MRTRWEGMCKDGRDSALGLSLPFLTGGLFFINNFPGVELMLVLGVLFNLVVGRGGGRLPKSMAIVVSVLVVMAAGFVGNIAATDADYLSIASYLAKFFVFFGLVLAGYSHAQVNALLRGFVVGATISSVLMMLNFFGFIDISPPTDYVEIRQSAFMGDPNIVATFLVFALMLAHHCIGRDDQGGSLAGWPFALRWFIVTAVFMGLLLTFSRAAWINLVLTLLFYFFVMPLWCPERRRSARVAAVFMFAVVLVVMALRSTSQVLDLFFDRFDPDLLSEAAYLRTRTQSQVLGEILDSGVFHLLFGHGALSSANVTGMNPHSTPYMLLYELGFFPGVFFVFCGLLAFWKSIKFARAGSRVLYLLPPCLFGFAVNSLAVDTFYWRLPWLYLALVAVAAVGSRTLPVGRRGETLAGLSGPVGGEGRVGTAAGGVTAVPTVRAPYRARVVPTVVQRP